MTRAQRKRLVERAILLDLEEASIYADEAMGATPAEMARFAIHAYRVLHWINSPGCRNNHKNWKPKPSKEAIESLTRRRTKPLGDLFAMRRLSAPEAPHA